MGKCLLHVDSYLLFLFLDRAIKTDFSVQKVLTQNASETENNSKKQEP